MTKNWKIACPNCSRQLKVSVDGPKQGNCECGQAYKILSDTYMEWIPYLPVVQGSGELLVSDHDLRKALLSLVYALEESLHTFKRKLEATDL